MKTVLVVEDEKNIRDILLHAFQQQGQFEILLAENAEGGMNQVSKADIILLNLNLPDMPGTEFLARLRDAGKFIPVIIVTAVDVVEGLEENLRKEYGIVDFFSKPFCLKELTSKVSALLAVQDDITYIPEATQLIKDFNHKQTSRIRHREANRNIQG